VPQRKKRVSALVVDDNHDAAESLAIMLSLIGCDSSFVTDSRLAFEKARELKPQVAFLDLGMPHLNGYDLARKLRTHFAPGSLQIVALTAYGEPKDRVASRQAGFDAHVTKPVSPELVEAIIKTVLPD
jgi:CheY-like chemotaxis protein